MEYKQNLHIHSNFCDGADAPEDTVKSALEQGFDYLIGSCHYFEVNTGAIARGCRTTPYPNPFIIKELKRLGFGAVITSDCHDRNQLNYGYDLSAQILKECGYKEIFVLTENGFVPKGL